MSWSSLSPDSDMEAVLLPFVFDEAAVALVMEVFEDLAQRSAEVLGRDILIWAAAEVGNLHIAPVGQVERGSVSMR